MKKLVTTLAVLMLLMSAIGLAFQFAPAKSVPTWHLEVSTSPAIVDTYIPGGIGAGQTGDYPVGWNGPITAPATSVLHNVSGHYYEAWNFDHWEENGTISLANPVAAPYAPYANPAAGDYINLTAVFLTYYYLKVNSPYGLPTTGEGWYTPGSTANAGVTSGSEWVSYGVFWYFDHWSGDASGSNFASSNGILMNSGKTASALWYVQYYLEYHSPEFYDGFFWHNWLGFDGASCYNNSVVVPLTAPALGETNDMVWQFRFDHWDKNGVFYSNNAAITVTISGAPVNMTAYYYEYDYLTFNDNIGGLSGVSALTGWYKYGTTVPFTPPAGTPIPNGAGMQLRWAWWDENNVFYSSSMTINYYVAGAKTLTARYQQQYKVTLDTYPTLPTTVQIQGSSVTGTAPINGFFDAGSNLVFWVPDVAVLVPGSYKWQFETGPNGQWWLNGVFWGAGAGPNGTGWRWAGYNGLNQPLNVKANYTKYYYVSWDTNPTGLSGPNPPWVGSGWFKAGSIVQGGIPPNWYNPVWAFKDIIDNGVSQGVGVSNYYLDSGSLSQAHVLLANYVNATAFYITPSTVLMTAPKYCTNFDMSVAAANFDASRGKDLWALDFKIYYNSTLLKLVAADYAPYLDALWGAGKWFVAKKMNPALTQAAGTYTGSPQQLYRVHMDSKAPQQS